MADERARRRACATRPRGVRCGGPGRRAAELLRAGESIAIFPQGTVKGGVWTRGAARLALETGSPLVPVRIVGSSQALSRGRVGLPRIRVVIGEPILVAAARPTVAAARALTRELQARVDAAR